MTRRRTARALLASWLAFTSAGAPLFAAELGGDGLAPAASSIPALPALPAGLQLNYLIRTAGLPPAAALSAPQLAQAEKLRLLSERAGALADTAQAARLIAALSPGAPAPAGLRAPLSQAARDNAARSLLESAGKTLASISEQDLREMPAEQVHALAAELLGEAGAGSAASTPPAEPAPASAPAADVAITATAGLVETLRSPEKTAALLASLGPGYEKLDPARFAREALAVYAAPTGSTQGRSLAALRETAKARSAAELAGLTTAVARLGARGDAKQAAAAELDALKSALGGAPEQALDAAERLRGLIAELPASAVSRAAFLYLDDLELAQRGVKAVADLNRLTAEGMVRAAVYRPTEAQLRRAQASWPRSSDGQPVADVVVVGAGPAGLAAGVHAAAAGLKTVVLEGGYVAQSFSDAAMKPIYRMRTPAPRNSLVQTGFSPAELVAKLGMMARLKTYRARGQLADDELFRAHGRAPIGNERKNLGPEDSAVASARNELLQHYADVAEEIVRRGGVLREQAPAARVEKGADGLWRVTTADGRVQLARKLVLGQGQVGTQSEFGAFGQDLAHLAQAYPDVFLTLRDRRSLSEKSSALHQLLRGQRRDRPSLRRLIVHDALLGSPEVERSLQLLPPGTQVGVVGSGESAVKAAMAVLRQNPQARVHLFTQGELTPNQLQVPAKHIDPDFMRRAMGDAKTAEECIKEWKAFGVPVTPGTIADLKEQAAAGRLVIHPLGRKLIVGLAGETDEAATVVARVEAHDGRTWLRLFDRETGRDLIAELDGPLVTATGYSRRALRLDPLTQQLLEQGRLRFKSVPGKLTENEVVLGEEHPLSSALDPDLYLIGAQNYAMSADSAIPGGVARAAVTVAEIARELQGRAPAVEKAAVAAAPAAAPAKRQALRWLAPAGSLVAGLAMIEAALDARGTALPGLIDGHFGHGGALAMAAVAYNVAGIVGRQFGGAMLSRFGLRRGYAAALGLRALALAALAGLVFAGALSLPALLALIALDGFLYGAAFTAETVAPARLVGQDQHALERVSMWQQLLLPVVSIAAPLVVGGVVAAFGFALVLVAVPLAFAAAAVWFGATLRVSPDDDRAPAARGFFASLKSGAAAAFSTPLLRTAFAGYILFNLLSPLLYAMVAPIYALRVTSTPEHATAVFSWLAGLYSAGWLLAGLVMRAEQRRIARGADAPRLLRRSVLKWMGWGATALLAVASFAFSPAPLGQLYDLPRWLSPFSALTFPALSMIPFGMAQILATVKLRTLFQARLPRERLTDGSAFLGAASLAAVTAGVLALKSLFGAFAGLTPFALIAVGLLPLAAAYVWLQLRLRRQLSDEPAS